MFPTFDNCSSIHAMLREWPEGKFKCPLETCDMIGQVGMLTLTFKVNLMQLYECGHM